MMKNRISGFIGDYKDPFVREWCARWEGTDEVLLNPARILVELEEVFPGLQRGLLNWLQGDRSLESRKASARAHLALSSKTAMSLKEAQEFLLRWVTLAKKKGAG